MSELIAIQVANTETAFALRKDIEALGRKFAVEAEDVAVIERLPDGRVKLHQQVDLIASHAIGGTIWGAVLGAVFLMPIIGAAVGAGVGALTGSLVDIGIDDGFLKDLGRQLAPGTAAVGLLARHVDAGALHELVDTHHGTVMSAALSDDTRAALHDLIPEVTTDPAKKPVADYRDPPTL